MKREVKSFWYPTWLAQPAAMVPGSKLIDAPAHDLAWEDIAHEFDTAELVILTPRRPALCRTSRRPTDQGPQPQLPRRLCRRQGNDRDAAKP
jgi:hypothetical protein